MVLMYVPSVKQFPPNVTGSAQNTTAKTINTSEKYQGKNPPNPTTTI